MAQGLAAKIEDVFKAGGGKLLGALVYWTLEGVHWERDAMRAAWAVLGLDAAIGRPPSPASVLSDAIARSQAGTKNVISRRLSRESWALVHEQAGDDGTLTHRHQATVAIEDGKLAVRFYEGESIDPAITRHVMRVQGAFADIAAYAGTIDLSQALVTAMGGTARNQMLAGISMRDRTGGLYFVPGSQVDRMRKLAALIKQHNSGCNVYVLGLYADDDNIEAASQAARASFTAQLNELRQELSAFVSESKEKGREITERHSETRARRLEHLNARVSLWTEVLGDVANELREQIAIAQDDVIRELGV